MHVEAVGPELLHHEQSFAARLGEHRRRAQSARTENRCGLQEAATVYFRSRECHGLPPRECCECRLSLRF